LCGLYNLLVPNKNGHNNVVQKLSLIVLSQKAGKLK